ncbi:MULTISPECIES: DUF917 domain-containing protein [Amycolatopsis]|uniref:DUF917 domain-containing protein n=1 Tax=Amycolatopsis methanolica 239 TaxID=1068978 RepID=A0A076MTU8_AMYME|nr:DUF917 domain-containing protein [Amycolatopsis methanolica]AIJ21212.1 hypothetical protein AMETH_1120 [Amycolatopsis methanolica 239]
MWQLGADDVDDLARGAELLGGGGGGEVRVATLLAKQLLRREPLTVLSPAELPGDARAVPIGLIGSVTVFEERFTAGTEFGAVVGALERHTGEEVSAVLAFEAAGVNLLLPVVAAARLGVPLLDADGEGRALPNLDQTVFTLARLPVTPMVLADALIGTVIIDAREAAQAERLARAGAVAMGGWALVGFAPQRARDLDRFAIRNSISLAKGVGKLLRRKKLDELLDTYGGRILFRGTIVETDRRYGNGYGRGTLVLQHAEDSERFLHVEFQNEYYLAVENGELRASVPDVICLLSSPGMNPLRTEHVRNGLTVTVLALPCAPAWRTSAGLGLAGPRAFGYDVDYTVPNGVA